MKNGSPMPPNQSYLLCPSRARAGADTMCLPRHNATCAPAATPPTPPPIWQPGSPRPRWPNRSHSRTPASTTTSKANRMRCAAQMVPASTAATAHSCTPRRKSWRPSSASWPPHTNTVPAASTHSTSNWRSMNQRPAAKNLTPAKSHSLKKWQPADAASPWPWLRQAPGKPPPWPHFHRPGAPPAAMSSAWRPPPQRPSSWPQTSTRPPTPSPNMCTPPPPWLPPLSTRQAPGKPVASTKPHWPLRSRSTTRPPGLHPIRECPMTSGKRSNRASLRRFTGRTVCACRTGSGVSDPTLWSSSTRSARPEHLS
ncbi:Uncharacterised protein [Mycobacteroides abscessus subsp. abscessus]|nr:Uncharacterised protein [Mycobacteroides abscessus subsp. abscessus]SHS78027.1 Uncharacterised protein [Mycobacteroides abscessus subsp. abscessus]SHS89052.1 Uncharacterised protein [Mycobacteroides abscessus subsp. abscessus]SHV74049.1 Uncharacterised protein [Mycobacteroides abscessus subsp. abscessus]SIL26603.1 Uncharacterised protein [Mycobacteroides abscessus subsp. abscessus]